MIKPKKLNRGDRIAIVSLSSGILGESFCKHELDKGIQRMKDFGLIPIFMPHTLKGIDYLDKHPEKRAQDLIDAFSDDTIKGVFCAIGGEDTYRLIPYLMSDGKFIQNIIAHPKVFIGFSDSTNNHLFFYHYGLVTYYGISFITDLCELSKDMLPYTKNSFLQLFHNENKTVIHSSSEWYMERELFDESQIDVSRASIPEKNGYIVIRGSGIIEGNLLGGCLESISDIITGNRDKEEKRLYQEYDLFPRKEEWSDKILFIETSEETPDPIQYEAYLNSLKEYGILEKIRGIIVGKPMNESYFEEYQRILKILTEEYQTPILYNLNFGHSYPKAIIPYGLKAKVDFNQGTLTIMEPLFEE